MEDKQIALNGVVASLGTSKFEAPEVSIADIKANPEKYVLLDVRSEEERAVSTIPGSIHKAQFEEDTAKYADKEVVCFCTVGYISAGATCEFSAHVILRNLRSALTDPPPFLPLFPRRRVPPQGPDECEEHG